jgi:selenocysteine lyase/cysteine desulfurase
LYVAPQWREKGVPLEQSWLARAGSEDFARLLDYTDAYRVGARRFDMGEFPQFVLVPMAIAALEQIRAWGVERIQQTLSILVSHVASEAVNIGASTVDAAERMGHLTGIRLAGGLPHGLAGALAEAQVYVSIRGDSVRVAPHLYNDRSDIDRFLVVLRQYASRATRLPRARDAQRGGAPA